MMTTRRRDVLRAGLAAGLSLGLDGFLPLPGLHRLVFAAGPASTRGLLVVVHQRGGCDGLNLISPADDTDFIAARGSDLRVANDGPEPGHPLGSTAGAKVDFRLHAAAKGLGELYDGRQLIFVHAAGLTNATRSHFVATDMIERGVADSGALDRATDGWLARYLTAIHAAGLATAIGTAPALSGEFLRWSGALAVPDLAAGFAPPGGQQVDDVLGRLYGAAPGDVGVAGRSALAAMRAIDARLPRDAQRKIVPYQPEHAANYDVAGDLGRPLRTVAQLAKMDIALEYAAVDIGGWDTHEYQPGRFRSAVERLSTGIAAFYEDMSRFHDRLVIVVLSEFGRRLRSNKSNGTDHGRAGVIAVLGGAVAGGRMVGPWPGLSADRLDEGVDLAVATDYRRVLAEIIVRQGGSVGSLAGIFPGYTYPGPLGLFQPATSAAATKAG
jgi:uncharacterized protein (DUF1501 family)